MSSGKHSFRHTDAARLIRATTAAGLKVTQVVLKDGAVRLDVDRMAAIDDGDAAREKRAAASIGSDSELTADHELEQGRKNRKKNAS
jgi:hypothetical protein